VTFVLRHLVDSKVTIVFRKRAKEGRGAPTARMNNQGISGFSVFGDDLWFFI
jgi:hypothetical protein